MLGAEEPLPANGSCLLGSINLSEFVRQPFTKNAKFDYQSFNSAVRIATRYLNEVLDEGLPLHPLKEQQETVRDWRQIGLGIMGLADMLIKLNVVYGSEGALDICNNIGDNMINSALQESAMLAREFGAYPKYNDLVLETPFIKNLATPHTIDLISKYGLRNSQLLTIAPTGSISTMWGISGGIEPIFQISYTRNTKTLNQGEESFYEVFTPIAKEYIDLTKCEKHELPNTFVTSSQLHYKDRIAMQSVWQRYIDASISSTVNLKKETTVDEVVDLYLSAWKARLKGITIYRDGCKRAGILITSSTKTSEQQKDLSIAQLKELMDKKILESVLNDPDKCPMCNGEMIHANGCHECLDCGYSPCSI